MIWIYVPSKVSSDSAFPFKIGEPCLLEVDNKAKSLSVKSISKQKAKELGWKERKRGVQI